MIVLKDHTTQLMERVKEKGGGEVVPKISQVGGREGLKLKKRRRENHLQGV